MNNEDFEEYLWDTIHDVLMRVINDLENMQYDLSVVERLRDEPKRVQNFAVSGTPSWDDVYKIESEEKKDDL